jgi:pimeloyl-ACP methyl ester carboxylesterase
MVLLLIGILALSCISTSIFKQQNQALAQSYVQTIKYRNLVIDLGNGVKTNAQLTYPAIGKGPFPGVLLISGSGANDKNGTLGFIHKSGPKPPTPYWQIAQYLSERGFAVLRYDKRGVGANITINQNVWGNNTVNDLIHDAEKALNVLIQQPEVDPKRISIIGHSEGTFIAPRVAIDNSTKVKNIILMGAIAQTESQLLYFQVVSLPLLYAQKVLDHNHDGLISIQQIAKTPLLIELLVPSSVIIKSFLTNNTKIINNALVNKFSNNTGYINIDKQLKPELVKFYESLSVVMPGKKCMSLESCPIWLNSYDALEPNSSVIENVPQSTSILILQGENDSLIPVQQAFLLQQRLTEINHPDHTLITYPNLGHQFYPSSQWYTGIGPFEPYVIADIYAWLEAHSGLSHPYVTTPTSTIGVNSSSPRSR